ncbi:MAG: Ig-like domain-containing protein [Acidobacteria bacterium]|nr:Ig-like domain-containing protein [Acidobacteriota bacterium]
MRIGFCLVLAAWVAANIAGAQPPVKRPIEGQIIADPANPSWLKRQGGGPFFLCSPGDPEGFLYRGKRNADGTRAGDQLSIIRKLATHGGNGIYLTAVRTHGGDAWKDKQDSPEIWPDDWHNPWKGQNPANGLNEAILSQWEKWFAEMDRSGIVIYFFFYDDAINVAKQFGWALDEEGRLDAREKDFVHTLVRRFQHHRNLIWCVMEEGQEIGADWRKHISAIAAAIREADEHDHVVATHQLPGNIFYHAGDPNVAQFAIQTHVPSVKPKQQFHAWMLEAWRLAAGRYSLNMSEDFEHGEMCKRGDRAGVRRRNWAAAMAGSYVMVLGMDGASTPPEWLADCRHLQRFFESTDFDRMAPADELAGSETEYVLAATGMSYILYSSASKSGLGLKGVKAGPYDVRWLDCVTGRTIERREMKSGEGEQAFAKPQALGDEVALYLRRRDAREPASKDSPPTSSVKPRTPSGPNRAPEVSDSAVRTAPGKPIYIHLAFTDPDGGPGPYSVSVVSQPQHGSLSGTGNDLVYTPREGFTGVDRFRWKVHDGAGESRAVDVTIAVSLRR